MCCGVNISKVVLVYASSTLFGWGNIDVNKGAPEGDILVLQKIDAYH